jgi:heat shock protein HtpX
MRLGRRMGRTLVDQIVREGPRRPGTTLSAIVALIICLGILAGIVLGAVFAATTLIRGDFNPLALPLLIILLLLPLAARPRVPIVDGPVMGRDRLPELFGLVDKVTERIGGRPVDGIVIDSDFNASFSRSGWTRRRILTIGLPLFAALSAQGRVALLGHELGHDINGDPTRGLVLGSGINAVMQLHATLEPDELLPSDQGIVAYIGLPITLLMLGTSRLVLGIAWLLAALTLRTKQRAEYYADAIGVRAGGRDAMLSLLDALHAAKLVSRMVWIYERSDPVGTIAEAVRTMPQGELERIRRVEQLAGSRLDYSHPPTTYRVEIITSMVEASPALNLSDDQNRRIDDELRSFRDSIGRRIVEDYEISVGS